LAIRTLSPNSSPDRAGRQIVTASPAREKLDLKIVLTELRTAKALLAAACACARDLDARIAVVAAQVVPYPLPLEKPPVNTGVMQATLGSLAAELPLEAGVHIYLCRDRWQTIRQVLPRESTVIVGGWKRWWWPSCEQRLARLLRRDGHRVIFMRVEAA
jgi:hypothetical protein